MDIQRELDIRERLTRLEKKVDFLLRELGLEEKEKAAPSRPNLGDIEELLRMGKKLEAVRRYRDRIGGSLAEASNAVERIEQEIRTK